MADPENHMLRILREMRSEMHGFHQEMRSDMDSLKQRMDGLRQAINGESVLGRYAAAKVEERLDALEKRISALETRS